MPSINSASIQDQVVNALRDMLLEGEIAPGSLITEAALASLFGVSRTPIREALKQLQVEGLIEVRPRVGTFASMPSLEESAEIAPVREVLEGLAARLCALNPHPETVAKLEANIAGSEADVAEERTGLYALKVRSFHDIVMEGANNPELAQVYRQLINKLSYHRRVLLALNQPGRPEHSVHEHRQILNHIRDGRPGAAENAMRMHVQESHRHFLAAIKALLEGEGGDQTPTRRSAVPQSGPQSSRKGENQPSEGNSA